MLFPEKFHLLVYTGLLFFISQASGRLANYLKAPRLTGYLIAGILFGPSVLGLFSESLVRGQLALITDIALAIIAFSIGGTLRLEKLKGLKKSILWITFLQAFAAAAVVFVTIAFVLPKMIPTGYVAGGFKETYLPIALVLGAISAATAPAAILSLTHEYKAKGPFTTVLLGVIALDDALTLMFYAFAITVASSMIGGESITWQNALLEPILSMALALILGTLVGLSLKRMGSFLAPPDVMLGLLLGAILFTSGLAVTFDLSPLLSNMMLGFVIANLVKHERAEKAFGVVESVEEPIFGVFFALAGAHLNLGLALEAGWLAVILTITRFSGKLLGTRFGAAIGSAPETVKRYLGIALLPAAGVTMGLVLDARATLGSELPYLTELMVSAVVGAILVNELLTPFLVRFSLFHTGEAQIEL